MRGTLEKLAKFLGKPLKEEDYEKLIDHLSIENMKKIPDAFVKSASGRKGVELIRKGEIGRNPEMTEEISKKFDKWTEEKLKQSNFKAPW